MPPLSCLPRAAVRRATPSRPPLVPAAAQSVAAKVHVTKYSGQRAAVDAYVLLHRGAYTCAREICEGEPTDKQVLREGLSLRGRAGPRLRGSCSIKPPRTKSRTPDCELQVHRVLHGPHPAAAERGRHTGGGV